MSNKVRTILFVAFLTGIGLYSLLIPDHKQELLLLINAERLTPLKENPLLTTIAQFHSEDMAARDYLAHGSLENQHGDDRLKTAGYRYIWWGEVLAGGTDNAELVLQSSPKHKEVMLDLRYTEIGIGYAYSENSYHGHYWTVLVAAPKY